MDYGDNIFLNQNVGSDYRLGIRAGDFQTPGPFTTRGAQIGNTFAYSFKFGADREAIINYTLTAPGYIPLSDLISNIQTASIVDQQLVLNIPRSLQILTTTSGGALTNVVFSGYEFYDRKMTSGKMNFSLNNYTTGRPFKALTSIYVECNSYPQSITISTMPNIDIPYTFENNLGTDLLQVLSLTSPTGAWYYSYNQSSLPYTCDFHLEMILPTSDPQTLNGNVLRPVVNISNFPTLATSDPAIALWFAVTNYEYGFKGDTNVPQILWENPYPNNMEKVIGSSEPYSIGWTDWKG